LQALEAGLPSKTSHDVRFQRLPPVAELLILLEHDPKHADGGRLGRTGKATLRPAVS
jgi:hypothetical protein